MLKGAHSRCIRKRSFLLKVYNANSVGIRVWAQCPPPLQSGNMLQGSASRVTDPSATPSVARQGGLEDSGHQDEQPAAQSWYCTVGRALLAACWSSQLFQNWHRCSLEVKASCGQLEFEHLRTFVSVQSFWISQKVNHYTICSCLLIIMLLPWDFPSRSILHSSQISPSPAHPNIHIHAHIHPTSQATHSSFESYCLQKKRQVAG